MTILSIPLLRNSAAVLAAAFVALPSFAQTSAAPASALAPAKVDKAAEKPADAATLSTAAVAQTAIIVGANAALVGALTSLLEDTPRY